MKNYNPSVGYLKALGILLMVLGYSGNTLHINHFIYMFHMPLFFIASGYISDYRYLRLANRAACRISCHHRILETGMVDCLLHCSNGSDMWNCKL